MTDLAKAGGRIAREHFSAVKDQDITVKGSRDYVSHVDRQVEAEVVRRIRARHPDHQILGEEASPGTVTADAYEAHRPLWVVDPIDGTTNFIHGIPTFAISIAFIDGGQPRFATVYNPVTDELFTAERGAGVWLNGERRYCSPRAELGRALIATAMPFRFPAVHDDALRVFDRVQRACDDQRRGGSAALDLAYVAVGRLDAYYELGIYPWDTAAGELLVRCGGGVATDFRGSTDDVVHRRSIVAAGTTPLHESLLAEVQPLVPWLERPPFG
ncbi:MAG: inositol monophosphatase [Planctomycetes bacterium]|nr:inositol monophosphatase [Planctomycetota bacterium]